MIRTCTLAAFLVWGASCTAPPKPNNVQGASELYFSLEAYFTQEASRLQELNPSTVKTVSKNGETEQRNIRVSNWKNELALFIDSDINKPAWRHSYKVDSTGTAVNYTNIDPELRTKRIEINKLTDGTIKHIRITNQVANMLYRTEEQLDYYPDSLYQITKQQHVRVIGESQYLITGAIL